MAARFRSLKMPECRRHRWIRIPGTHIDEPIVQTTDNESYRSIGLDGKPDPAGTVFLDCESAPDASDFHSIFYGHHMKDGSRFSELIRLKDEDSSRSIGRLISISQMGKGGHSV